MDVGINKANIEIIEKSLTILVKNNVRVYYFDSHSNKYKGQPLLYHLPSVFSENKPESGSHESSSVFTEGLAFI